MPFIKEILNHKSLSIVGLEKNTGKTECLNYILRRLKNSDKKIAVTSVGVDGESIDSVKNTQKPEIELFENVVFITSESHYRQKKITAAILDLSERRTALGRLVTARSLSGGKLVFSGPSDTQWLKTCIDGMDRYGVDTTLVDGAVSRLSLASPAVTEAMILCTGAAVSPQPAQIARKTRFVVDLIQLPQFSGPATASLSEKGGGVWSLDDEGQIHGLAIPSVFLIEKYKDALFEKGDILYFSGAVSDKLLLFLKSQKNIAEKTLVVRDFTRLFVSPEVLRSFQHKGGQIRVLFRPRLLAVCINPTSPEGARLDSAALRDLLEASLHIPVYDIKQLPE
jgi:hypothetical protein